MEKSLKDSLLRKALMLNASQYWYESEMKKVIGRLHKLESDPFVDFEDPEYVELQGKLDYIRKKGGFEKREVKAFQKKLSLLP